MVNVSCATGLFVLSLCIPLQPDCTFGVTPLVYSYAQVPPAVSLGGASGSWRFVSPGMAPCARGGLGC